jgi:hypothetical protein
MVIFFPYSVPLMSYKIIGFLTPCELQKTGHHLRMVASFFWVGVTAVESLPYSNSQVSPRTVSAE